MQNKPNFRNDKMNITNDMTSNYEILSRSTGPKNKANSNPIKPKTNPIQTQFKPIQTQFKANLSRRSPERSRIKLHPGQKNIFKPDNIKNNILSHYPAQPVRRDMRTSVNKMNISIENMNFKTTPEKDTIHPRHNEYSHHPFRTNKQGKHYRERVSLIKEIIEYEPIQLIIIIGDAI